MTFVQNLNPTYPKQPNNGKVTITNADGQNQKTVYTGGANVSKATSLIATSSDTSPRDVQVSLTNGGTSYLIGTVTVPAGAGNSGAVPSVNLFNATNIPGLAVDADGNPYIQVINGDTLTVSATTTVTAGKQITVVSPTASDF